MVGCAGTCCALSRSALGGQKQASNIGRALCVLPRLMWPTRARLGPLTSRCRRRSLLCDRVGPGTVIALVMIIARSLRGAAICAPASVCSAASGRTGNGPNRWFSDPQQPIRDLCIVWYRPRDPTVPWPAGPSFGTRRPHGTPSENMNLMGRQGATIRSATANTDGAATAYEGLPPIPTRAGIHRPSASLTTVACVVGVRFSPR